MPEAEVIVLDYNRLRVIHRDSTNALTASLGYNMLLVSHFRQLIFAMIIV
jgi:hypothetical protein